jgi:hypothetical protein
MSLAWAPALLGGLVALAAAPQLVGLAVAGFGVWLQLRFPPEDEAIETAILVAGSGL